MVDKIPSNKIGGLNQAGQTGAPKATDSKEITPATIDKAGEIARRSVPPSVLAGITVLEFAGHRKAA